MVVLSMKNEVNSVNAFFLKVLNDAQFRMQAYQDFMNNGLNLDGCDGCLSPDVLRAIVKRAKTNRKIHNMLPEILEYANGSSITDDIFRSLLHTHGGYRNTCLSAIAHLDLSFYQMQILNRCPLCLEAFSWLFDKICRYDYFTPYDMQQLLNEKSKTIHALGVEECIKFARDTYGSSEKLDVAEKWLKMHKHDINDD